MNSKICALVPVLALFIVVFSSGCTSFGGQTSSGQGIVIENFESDFQKIYAGETFKLQMKAKNTGSVDADFIMPELYNIDKDLNGVNIAISCANGCGETIKMLAKDADRGTEGESKTCIWNCKAPDDIPKGLSVTFNPSLRLYYLYRTTTIKSINIASQNELRALQTQGGALPSETVSTTEGPVQLDVVVNGPIRYWEGENTVTFPININLQNNGGGIACLKCSDPKSWNKIILTFENEKGTATLESCDLQTGKMEVDLWKGQSRTVTCEVRINVGQTTGFVQKSLSFEAGYDYFVDASTSIEVVGRD
ncbi:MAG: hypothetical protein V1648_04295 [Candidatus Aenigmatarchaeota archaeon]